MYPMPWGVRLLRILPSRTLVLRDLVAIPSTHPAIGPSRSTKFNQLPIQEFKLYNFRVPPHPI